MTLAVLLVALVLFAVVLELAAIAGHLAAIAAALAEQNRHYGIEPGSTPPTSTPLHVA